MHAREMTRTSTPPSSSWRVESGYRMPPGYQESFENDLGAVVRLSSTRWTNVELADKTTAVFGNMNARHAGQTSGFFTRMDALLKNAGIQFFRKRCWLLICEPDKACESLRNIYSNFQFYPNRKRLTQDGIGILLDSAHPLSTAEKARLCGLSSDRLDEGLDARSPDVARTSQPFAEPSRPLATPVIRTPSPEAAEPSSLVKRMLNARRDLLRIEQERVVALAQLERESAHLKTLLCPQSTPEHPTPQNALDPSDSRPVSKRRRTHHPESH